VYSPNCEVDRLVTRLASRCAISDMGMIVRCQVGEQGVAGREAPSRPSEPGLFNRSLVEIGGRSIISVNYNVLAKSSNQVRGERQRCNRIPEPLVVCSFDFQCARSAPGVASYNILIRLTTRYAFPL
jgi:hypothetical protein